MKGLAPLIGIIFLVALAIKYWWIVLIAVIVVGGAYLIIKTAAPPKAAQNTPPGKAPPRAPAPASPPRRAAAAPSHLRGGQSLHQSHHCGTRCLRDGQHLTRPLTTRSPRLTSKPPASMRIPMASSKSVSSNSPEMAPSRRVLDASQHSRIIPRSPRRPPHRRRRSNWRAEHR